uniref:Amidase domain-containing protein n=1 Tax=Branchiostoma floridae TaxID=7739 RepID=C3Z8N9_BRAFL|eukprot:XP_002595133.1 hypothetical protein BRAFLDRAFT_67915 [Branchiostoma floridae]
MDRVYNIIMDRMNGSESIVAYTAVSAGVLSCYVGLKVYRRQQCYKGQRSEDQGRLALQSPTPPSPCRSVQLTPPTTQGTPTAARRKEILSLTLTQLTQQLRDGQLSAVQVLQAFQEKTYEDNQPMRIGYFTTLPCCPPTPSMGRAVIMAKEALEKAGHTGMVTTLGVTKYLETPAGEDAVIVQVLKKQGAVPFVRTNIPQSLLSYSCSNPVFGNTVNPLDPERTSGGSSGGEAALIKAGGSVLGLGSDGLGSVRIPAHFCGICALKPTGLRISDRGLLKGTPGIQGVIAAPGLLARDVDSLALGLKALLVPDMFQLDPRVAPIPFQQEKYIEQFLEELKKKNIDLILCPAFGMPACKPEHASKALAATVYCSLFNLLDFPAGVVPVTMVTEEDDRPLDDWRGYGNDLMDKTTRGAVRLPVAVQCVALPWQEEKCLRLMKEVETLCPV